MHAMSMELQWYSQVIVTFDINLMRDPRGLTGSSIMKVAFHLCS